jgi:hypothetical protein
MVYLVEGEYPLHGPLKSGAATIEYGAPSVSLMAAQKTPCCRNAGHEFRKIHRLDYVSIDAVVVKLKQVGRLA